MVPEFQAFIFFYIFNSVCQQCNDIFRKFHVFILQTNYKMRSINDRDISFLEITAETQANHYNFL